MELRFKTDQVPGKTRYTSQTLHCSQDEATAALNDLEARDGIRFDEALFVPMPRGGHVLFCYVHNPA